MGMSQAYGPTDDTESIATVQRAIDLGITFLDTAMSYGAGHNERLLGQALAGRRDQVTLATKLGIVRDAEGVRVDAQPEHVRGYCEASLQRLGVEHIDLYYLHRVDPDVAIEETIGVMADLVAEGKVRHLGISEATVEQLERAAASHPISVLQSEWSLWWREIEDDVLPAARRLGIGIVPYSPLGRGFLTGTVATDALAADDLRRADPRFDGEALKQNQTLSSTRCTGWLPNARWRPASSRSRGCWPRAPTWCRSPAPNARERLEENAAAAAIELSTEDLARLEAVAPRTAWSGDRQSFAAHHTTRTPA